MPRNLSCSLPYLLEILQVFSSKHILNLLIYFHHSSLQSLFLIWIPIVASYLFFPLTCPHSPFSTESLSDFVKIKYDCMVHLLKTQQWLFIKTRIKAKLLSLALKALLTFFSDFSFSFLSLSLYSRYIGLPSVPQTCQVHFWLEVFALSSPPPFWLEGSFLRSSLGCFILIFQVSAQI